MLAGVSSLLGSNRCLICAVIGLAGLVTKYEAPADVKLGPHLTPVDSIVYASLGLKWMIWEVLDSWTNRDATGEVDRHCVRLWGPLPWKPGENGYFVAVVRRYSDRKGWWISPE